MRNVLDFRDPTSDSGVKANFAVNYEARCKYYLPSLSRKLHTLACKKLGRQ